MLSPDQNYFCGSSESESDPRNTLLFLPSISQGSTFKLYDLGVLVYVYSLPGRSVISMMLASSLPSPWVRESGVGEPLYSPYITSPTVATAAQAVNRSSGES